jgi:hypothetical protein
METLSSLRQRSDSSSQLTEQTEILHEFAREVTTDVTLKKICFTSRELIVVLFNFCDVVVSAPEIQSQAKKSYYDEKRLREIQIQHRLELFHGVLHVLLLIHYSFSFMISSQVFSCLFFASECLDRRFDVVSGSMRSVFHPDFLCLCLSPLPSLSVHSSSNLGST